MNKQLETTAAEQGKLVLDYEVQIRELGSQLALANECRSRLESQVDEIQTRTSMDSDERISKLQEDLQVGLGKMMFI